VIPPDAPEVLDPARLRARLQEVDPEAAAAPEDAIRVIRAHGLRTGALTNNWADADGVSHVSGDSPLATELAELFDTIVESARVGLRKPDPRIYELVCRELGVTPDRAVFLDDIGTNLKAARALGMRCEPGVGGRLVEVYDGATGEGYELGRITVWEPGKRLAWASSVDDVEIEVRFEATASGTDVTVEATIPDDGADRGGTAWVRVVPKWFGPWIARRDSAPGPQRELARLAVGVYYEKPATAARWLASAFGFESPDPLPR